jgi:phospholipid transport system substrate-binding protein
MKIWLWIGSLLWSTLVWSLPQDPVQLMEQVVTRVMGTLEEERDIIRRTPDKIYDIVNHLIVPHVDFMEMSRWVTGKMAWNAAGPEIQQAFVQEFKLLVIKTYAHALVTYSNHQVTFLPMHVSLQEAINQKRIQVSMLIAQAGKPPIHIDYRVLLESDQTWKVYDIFIEHVSLMQGYRAQFADTLKTGGLQAVINLLQRKAAA